MPAVVTEALTKRYRQGFRQPTVDALKSVTLTIPEGEIFGFLGPNGSGKTTLLKCLLNINFPTSGTLSILDQPVDNIHIRRHIGYLPESPYFYDRFNSYELLEFYGGLYGLERQYLRRRINEVIEEVDLGATAAQRPLRTYSKGMLQRIGIAQAILAEPRLIILDEPSTGLDPVGRRQIKDLIRGYHQRGHTVFLNTHILEDIEDICHRVGVIYKGELLTVETMDSLTRTTQMLHLRVRHWMQDASDAIDSLTEKIEVRPDGTIVLTLLPAIEAPAIVHALARAGTDIFSVTPQIVRLEDRFLDLLAARGGIPEPVRLQLLQQPSIAVPGGDDEAS